MSGPLVSLDSVCIVREEAAGGVSWIRHYIRASWIPRVSCVRASVLLESSRWASYILGSETPDSRVSRLQGYEIQAFLLLGSGIRVSCH